MKKSKPKGSTPSLIGGSLGRTRKRIVQRKSSCNRCKDDIPNGVECYEISQLGGSFSKYKPYCDDCYRSILNKTKADIEVLFIDIEN